MVSQSLPTNMQALVLDVDAKGYDQGKGFVARSVPTPTLDERNHPEDQKAVLLKTLYAGVCGSDKGLWFRRAFGEMVTDSLQREQKNWRIPGHEFLGQIVAVGSQVAKHYSFKIGDVVSTESHIFCGACYQCKHGQEHICQASQIIGFSQDGCFAQYIKLPANVLWPTNLGQVRPEVAAIQEPLGNAVHVCSAVNLQDQNVLISGCGTIGLFAVAIAKSMGAKRIIGLDTSDKQLALAKRMGATDTLKLDLDGPDAKQSSSSFSANHQVQTQIRQLTDRVGVDVALEMAGFNNSLNNCIQATRRGGDVVLFGMKSGDFTIQNYEDLIWSCKRLQSVAGRRLFATWKLMKELLESKPELQTSIYEVILNRGDGTILPFSQFTPELFEQSLDRHIKTIIKFN